MLRQRNNVANAQGGSQPRRIEQEPLVTSDPEPSRKKKNENAFEKYDTETKKGIFLSTVAFIFGIVGVKIEKSYSSKDGSSVKVTATPRLGLLTLVASILFVLPLFLCEPENIYPRGNEGENGACAATTKVFPFQSCGPFCSSLYYGRSLITSSIEKGTGLLKDGIDDLLVTLQLKEDVYKLLRVPDTPAWHLHRLGQPLINSLYSAIQTFIPAEKKLIMYATGFMHSAVLRAVSKLHLADILHQHELEVRRSFLKEQNETIQSHFQGREAELSVPSQRLALSLKELAKKSCTKPEFLQRLLHASQVLGAFYEISPGYWTQTEMSKLLRFDHPSSVKGGVEMMGGEQYVALSSLHLTVKSGKPAFSEIYGDFWKYQKLAQEEWKKLEQDPSVSEKPDVSCVAFTPKGMIEGEKATTNSLLGSKETWLPYELSSHVRSNTGLEVSKPRINNVGVPAMFAFTEFNQGMTALASSASKVVAQELPLSGVDTVVDIAGGHGHLLHEILRSNRHISTGVLFDMASVYDDSEAVTAMKAKYEKTIQARGKALERDNRQCKAAECPVPQTAFSFRHPFVKTGDASCESGSEKFVDEAGSSQGFSLTSALTVASDWYEKMTTSMSQSLSGAESRRQEFDAETLCANKYTVTGDFFNASTVPKAHEYALASLKHKYDLQINRRVAKTHGAEGALGTIELDDASPVQLRHSTAYVMMQILHDWSDTESIAILKNLHQAMTTVPPSSPPLCCSCEEGNSCSEKTVKGCGLASPVTVKCPASSVEYKSRLYIVDRVLQDKATFINSQGSNFADVLMMNNFNDAKERYTEDMERILNASGFKLIRVLPSRSMHSIVEAEPIVSGHAALQSSATFSSPSHSQKSHEEL